MSARLDFSALEERLDQSVPIRFYGRVTRVVGLLIETMGPASSVGDLCLIRVGVRGNLVPAEVVGFNGNVFFLMPYGSMEGIGPGCEVLSTGRPLEIKVGMELQGRVLNALGEAMDGGEKIKSAERYSIYRKAPDPMKRNRIDSVFNVGIKAIDGCLTLGVGQRIGIFSGAGVGKSTLLGMMARGSKADINVIGLIGERGREVREFIERDLGEEGLKKSVVVTVTSDEPALMRIKGAYVATSIAEYFRDQGKSVLLMMDSLTRFAMAKREVGLSIGEPPSTKGYTPSVFSELPKLLERAGMNDKGSITAFYTVLVEADDFNEPISDAVRAVLDGHILLSRRLASANHYPSVDILESISRLSTEVCSPEQLQWARKIKELISSHEEVRDLINIGAYVSGSNPKTDEAIAKRDAINDFLKQSQDEVFDFQKTLDEMKKIFRS